MKSKLGVAGIRTHDLRIRERVLYSWTTNHNICYPVLCIEQVNAHSGIFIRIILIKIVHEIFNNI